MNESAFRAVMAAAQLPPGTMREILIAGKDILLCHTKEGIFAVDDVCTHAAARMHEGRLRGTRLICPLHGASFDCRTGAVLGPPAAQPLATYPVRLNGGNVEIAI